MTRNAEDLRGIEQIGSPEDVVRAPTSAFVARFLSDATLVDGVAADGTFTSGSLTLEAEGSGPGTLAILPTDIDIVPGSAGDTGEVSGTVTSSLFGRDASDVLVHCDDVDFRCSTRGPQPEVGETVGLSVRRSFFCPHYRRRPEGSGHPPHRRCDPPDRNIVCLAHVCIYMVADSK